jgi:methanethiol S-methyltransferase
MASFFKIVLAFSAYAIFHSLLLTRSARLALEALFGQRAFRRWFRLCYSIQAAVLFLALLGYMASLPDTELVVIYGDGAWVLLALRLAGVGLIAWSLWSLGLSKFLGWENWREGRHGALPDGTGVDGPVFEVRGPFRWIRHPIYVGALPILWAVPHWTVNIFAFSLSATVYLHLGVRHEEKRHLETYGDVYRRYMAETPPFFPRLFPEASRRRRRGG